MMSDQIERISESHPPEKQSDAAVLKPSTGFIDLNQIYLDAGNLQLVRFNLQNFIEEKKWDKLTHIYIRRNLLRNLPDELFIQASNLVWLDVRWNELEQFPRSVKEHPNLQTVLLQNNSLSKIPIEFGSLDKLQGLSITNNPLEFPTKNVLSKCRTNADLINYLKLCWQEQRTDVLPIKSGTEKRAKRRISKWVPLKKVKDHTEMICRLRNSARIRDQIKAEKMLQTLGYQQKLIQTLKDRDVLKKWREKYKQFEPRLNSRGNTGSFSLDYSDDERIQKGYGNLQYINGNITSAIDDLQKQLDQIYLTDVGKDPEQVMKDKSRDMIALRDIQKKINYLKRRC